MHEFCFSLTIELYEQPWEMLLQTFQLLIEVDLSLKGLRHPLKDEHCYQKCFIFELFLEKQLDSSF